MAAAALLTFSRPVAVAAPKPTEGEIRWARLTLVLCDLYECDGCDYGTRARLILRRAAR